jgi:hypothetical protein
MVLLLLLLSQPTCMDNVPKPPTVAKGGVETLMALIHQG